MLHCAFEEGFTQCTVFVEDRCVSLDDPHSSEEREKDSYGSGVDDGPGPRVGVVSVCYGWVKEVKNTECCPWSEEGEELAMVCSRHEYDSVK